MENMFYEMVGRLFSRTQMKRLGTLIESAGMDLVPEAFAGFMVVLCFVLSIFAFLLLTSVKLLSNYLFRISLFISADLTAASSEFVALVAAFLAVLLTVALVGLITYVCLALLAGSRKRRVEEVLPDFLSLSAANVRAGMTIDQAMWYAAKPEFGILSQEISIVSKKAFGGVPFNQAIDYLSERFNSKSIRRAVALIKQGLASGGQIADILERTAEDARQMQILQKEIAASLLMYVIFIVFAGALGTPFLFAVSAKLVGIMETALSNVPQYDPTLAAQAQSTIRVTPTKPLITSADFFLFTILTAIMTAVFSALIIGVISKGSKKDGVPYIPFLLLTALTVFFLMSYLLEGFLSNIYI